MIEAMLWFVFLLLLIPILFVAGLVWTACSFVFRTAAFGVRLVLRPVAGLLLVAVLAVFGVFAFLL